MPQPEEVQKDEQFQEEEEESKFPIWIIPLVVGPIILVVLIALLAGNPPPTTNNPVSGRFNEPELKKEAIKYQSEAMQLYYKAQELSDQKKKDQLYTKAMAISGKALDKIDTIRQYYEEHNIQKKQGGTWDWEKIESELSQLRSDIIRDKGFGG